MGPRRLRDIGRERVIGEREVGDPELLTVHAGGFGIAEGYTRARAEFPARSTSPAGVRYPIAGSMISAKAARARFSRDFTVPRLQPVISAISSYGFPSSSRSTNTWR